MDEAARCDRVALMQTGQILAVGRPDELVAEYPLPLVEVRGRNRYRLLQALRKAPHVHSVYPFGETLHYTDVRADAGPDAVAGEVRAFARDLGFTDVSAAPAAPDIEDTFMLLMGGAGEPGS